MNEILSANVIRRILAVVIAMTTVISLSYAAGVSKCGPASKQRPDSAEKVCPENCEAVENTTAKVGGRADEYRFFVFKKGTAYAGEGWQFKEDLDKRVVWNIYDKDTKEILIGEIPPDESRCNYSPILGPKDGEIICGRTCCITAAYKAASCPGIADVGSVPLPTPGPGQKYETRVLDVQEITYINDRGWWTTHLSYGQYPVNVKGEAKIEQRLLVSKNVPAGTPTPTPFEVGKICEKQTLTFYAGATPTPLPVGGFGVTAYGESGGMETKTCPYDTGCP